MQWNYQKIEYFLKVAETLNFTKAAKELYITPQSLNKQILQFEQELGEALFERTTRRVTLTDTGRKLKEAFTPAYEAYGKAARSMNRYIERHKRTIRIAFFQAISKKEAITPIANYLRACDPGIQVELLGGEMEEVVEWLYQKKCDLVITNIHEFEILKDVQIIPFVKTPAKIVISQYHPWMVKEEITLADMEQVPILLLARKKAHEANSFYRNLNVKEREYAPNFSSLIANLEVSNTYAVMPELFESMNHAGLQFLELPKESVFYYQMVAIYMNGSPFSELFDHLQDLTEEGVIQIQTINKSGKNGVLSVKG